MARVPFVQDAEASADFRAAFEAANSFNGRALPLGVSFFARLVEKRLPTPA